MTIDRASLFLGAATGFLAATLVAKFGPELVERVSATSLGVAAALAIAAAWVAWGPRSRR